MSTYIRYPAITGTVLNVTASSPLASSGGTSPNLSIAAHSIVGQWSSALTFAPAAAFGTVTNQENFTRRVGDSLEARISGITGTSSAGIATYSLPIGLTIDSTKLPVRNPAATQGVIQIGTWVNVTNSADTAVSSTDSWGPVYYAPSDTGKIFLALNVGNQAFKPAQVSDIFSTSDAVSINISIPITQYA